MQLLFNRGIINGDKNDPEKIREFLEPDFVKDTFDPYLIKGMKKAVGLIKGCPGKIGIFADFDVDGVTSSTLLAGALKKINKPFEIFIPLRSEGYGLNKKGIDELKSSGCELLVTVDMGISAVEEIAYAHKLGMKIAVLDHHEPGKILPKADALIDLKLNQDEYPFKELSAGGLVFKLLQALSKEYPKNIDLKFLKWSLDLTAISTICDVVPLSGENRTLAKYGLIVLSKSRRPGLLSLYQAARIEPRKIDAYVVGFLIGPRLNAPGRIDSANLSSCLLLTEDEKEAADCALKLNKMNVDRQEILRKSLVFAKEKIIEEKLTNEKIIVLKDKSWPEGIVGLIAGQIKEEFSRPALIFSEGEESSRGSARSIDEFDIVSAMRKFQDLFEAVGGHKKAAGATIKNENYLKLKKGLEKLALEKISEEDIQSKIKVDKELRVADLTMKLARELKKFEPAGMGNPRPTFMIKRLELVSFRTVGKENKHLKMSFKIDNHKLTAELENPDEASTIYLSAIHFNGAHHLPNLKIGDKLDLVFGLEINEWNNRENLELKILDLKK